MNTIKEVYEVADQTGFFNEQQLTYLCDWEFDEMPNEGDIVEISSRLYKVYAIVFIVKYQMIQIRVTKL